MKSRDPGEGVCDWGLAGRKLGSRITNRGSYLEDMMRCGVIARLIARIENRLKGKGALGETPV
jgi:hypothetical protein